MAFNNLFGLYGGMLMHLIAWFLVFGFIFADQGAQLYRPAVHLDCFSCLRNHSDFDFAVRLALRPDRSPNSK